MQLNISQASGNWRYKWVCIDTAAQILLAFGPGSMQDLHIFPPPIFPSFPSSQGHMVQLLSLKTFTRTHSLRDTLLWVSDTLGCQTASKGAWEESWISQPHGSQLICNHPDLVLRPTTSQKAKPLPLVWNASSCGVQGQPLRTQRSERTGTMSQPNHSCFFSLSLILSCKKTPLPFNSEQSPGIWRSTEVTWIYFDLTGDTRYS